MLGLQLRHRNHADLGSREGTQGNCTRTRAPESPQMWAEIQRLAGGERMGPDGPRSGRALRKERAGSMSSKESSGMLASPFSFQILGLRGWGGRTDTT